MCLRNNKNLKYYQTLCFSLPQNSEYLIYLYPHHIIQVRFGKATVIEEIEYHGMTSDEAKNIYIEHYASGIQEILGKFYVEMCYIFFNGLL